MVHEYLLPETTLREPGLGPEVPLGETANRPLSLILNITRTSEQQSLDVSICGSADGTRWGPLVKVPRQFYCGTYRTVLDLSGRSDIRFLRAIWQVARWGKQNVKPLFTVELLVQDMQPMTAGA
jgi:hypothetical protein